MDHPYGGMVLMAMQLSTLRETELLTALYQGMFEQPHWHTFLTQLATQTGASCATLTFVPVDQDTAIALYAGHQPPPDLQRIFEEWHRQDPLNCRRMREGRVYSRDELLGEYEAAPCSPRGGNSRSTGQLFARSVRVTEASGVDAWLSCVAPRELGSAVAALLSALVPHLRTAMRCFIALERERFRSTVNTDAIGRLNFGWLTLDARCRIIDMTPRAEELFRRSGMLRRDRYDRLTPASPALDREVSELVKRFAEDAEARPRAINISPAPWVEMLVAPIKNRSLSASSTPVAIAYLSGDRCSQADRCEQLVDLFGLLPSEARVAWAMAQGRSMAEAAQELCLTIETVRGYSKKIYAKTGARGQAELVRNIVTSVLALA